MQFGSNLMSRSTKRCLLRLKMLAPFWLGEITRLLIEKPED